LKTSSQYIKLYHEGIQYKSLPQRL